MYNHNYTFNTLIGSSVFFMVIFQEKILLQLSLQLPCLCHFQSHVFFFLFRLFVCLFFPEHIMFIEIETIFNLGLMQLKLCSILQVPFA